MKLRDRLLVSLVVGIILTLFSGFGLKLTKNFDLQSNRIVPICESEINTLNAEPFTDTKSYGMPVAYIFENKDYTCSLDQTDIDFKAFALNVIFWSGIILAGQYGYKMYKNREKGTKNEVKK